MDISKLKTILTVSEHSSITAAANDLYITPVSLWEQINRAENELGFKIFVRSRKGIALSAAGRCFCDGLKSLLPAYDQLLDKCSQTDAQEQQTLGVAMYAPYFFHEYCEKYNQTHPAIHFAYGQSDYTPATDRKAYMVRHRFDIMQECYSPSYDAEGLLFLPLQSERFFCFSSSDGIPDGKKTLTIDELRGKALYCALSISIDTVLLERWLRAAGLTLHRIPYDDFNVMSICSRGDIYIGEEALSTLWTQTNSALLECPISLIHGIVYFPDASEETLRFVDWLRQEVGEERIAALEAQCRSMARELEQG